MITAVLPATGRKDLNMEYSVFWTHDGMDKIKTFTNKQKAIDFYNRCKFNGYHFVSKDF